MNLASMNKFHCWLVVILTFFASNVSVAQNVDTFWGEYARLQNSGNHLGMIKLLQNNKMLFENSNDIDRFVYHILLANSQLSINDIDNGTKALNTCSLLHERMDSVTLQKLKDDETLNLLLGKYHYLIGKLYFYNGYYQDAEANLLECYNTLIKRNDHEKLGLFRDLHLQLGLFYMRFNNMPSALRYLRDSKLGSEANLLFDNVYCRTLMMLGFIYLNQEDFLKAKMYFDEAAYTLENLKNTGDIYMIQAMLSSCYLKMGYKAEAKRIVLNGISQYQKVGSSNSNLSMLYSALGNIHFTSGDYASAKAIFKKAYDIAKKDKSKSDYERLTEYSNLAIAQFVTNDMKYKRMTADMSVTIIEDVIQQFSFLSSDERARYWNQQSDYLAKFNAMLFLSDDNKYFDQVYNNTVFSKGLLLRTTNQISQQLSKTKNESLRESAFRLQKLQKKILSEEMTPQKLKLAKDSIRLLEKELVTNLVGYQSVDSLRNQYDFQYIKRSLCENEAAIEFIKLPELTINADTINDYYAAIIFNKDADHPHIVRLCSDETLARIQQIPDVIKDSRLQENAQNELYRQYLYGNGDFVKKRLGKKPIKFTCVGDSLYKLIWQPLESYLQETSTVYYSTSGQLSSIAFNALSVDSISLSEKYSLHCLSSTSEIPTIKSILKDKPLSATLYGGINYDTSREEMQSQSRGYSINSSRGTFEARSANGERGSWGFLSGSEKEAVDIAAQLTSCDIDNKLLTSSQANEESFKANSGHSPNLFHIATHGFFYSDAKDKGVEDFLRGIKGLENVNSIQATLSRAGILFSGANRAWRGESTEKDIEDGILTAEEVSHLDLSNTDMVVLSACETGLGKDVASEGVFGLQRAFKLAGVKTLVMSLWKVPDAETSQLMQLFYANWLGGMNKHEAFQTAQLKIKESHPNPYFWAGFIMLD